MDTLSEAKAVAEQDLDPHAKIAVYGPPGVGKTGFASDALPEIFPIRPEETLYLNIESGKLTLKTLGRQCKVIDIAKMIMDPKETEKRKAQGLPTDPFTHLEMIHRDLVTRPHPYKTVILDSLSSLQKEDLDTVARVTMEKSPKDNRIHGIFGKQQADYGINTDKMRFLMRAYRDLRMNVVFILGETQDKGSTGLVTTVPDLTPKLRESLYPMMDVVAYMYNTNDSIGDDDNYPPGTIKRCVFANPGINGYKTKDRSGALTALLVNKTLPHVLKAMADKIDASQAGAADVASTTETI